MKDLGWRRSRLVANLFTKKIDGEIVMLLVYVDDLFILGPDEATRETIEALRTHFTVKETGELNEAHDVQFLGRTIKRDLRSICKHLRITCRR